MQKIKEPSIEHRSKLAAYPLDTILERVLETNLMSDMIGGRKDWTLILALFHMSVWAEENGLTQAQFQEALKGAYERA